MSVTLKTIRSGKVKTVALIGNPNTGKTTLFNALTGLSQRVGNYPGVTVERRAGPMKLDLEETVQLLDLPGTYSLAANSPDEMIVADVLLGRQVEESSVDAVVAIVDAANLRRNLYLVSQVMEFGIPTVIALNMVDLAESAGIRVDPERLSGRLGIPVVPICANKKRGLNALRHAIAQALSTVGHRPGHERPRFLEPLGQQIEALSKEIASASNGRSRRVSEIELYRAVVDEGGYAERRVVDTVGPDVVRRVSRIREKLQVDRPLSTLEAESRYAWIDQAIEGALRRPPRLQTSPSDRIDRFLTHRIFGTIVFAVVMGIVFQSIYAWALPLMDGIEALFSMLGRVTGSMLPAGAVKSLVVDGVIGGLGSVIVFLPQIAILFFFLAILEGCGYMSRAALLMDGMFRWCGLSGKSFVPMISSFACAIPGIMATRTIEDPRSRLMTILVTPLMSCSARLPVYTLFIGAFIPNDQILGGWVGVQGLTLLAMYSVGAGVAIPVAWLLKKHLFAGNSPPFVMELPSYKWPDLETVSLRVYLEVRTFIARAGTIILAAAVVMWALAYFPRPAPTLEKYRSASESVRLSQAGEMRARALAALDTQMRAELLEQSLLGRAGRFVEPAVRPLGWDWRIGMAAMASFPAREIVVASLGTIFSVGNQVDETSAALRTAMRTAVRADGSPLFTIPVALSIMVFFALCAQCAATLAVMQRETRSWKWPIFAFTYLTGLAYIGAFVTYQSATALGWGS